MKQRIYPSLEFPDGQWSRCAAKANVVWRKYRDRASRPGRFPKYITDPREIGATAAEKSPLLKSNRLLLSRVGRSSRPCGELGNGLSGHTTFQDDQTWEGPHEA